MLLNLLASSRDRYQWEMRGYILMIIVWIAGIIVWNFINYWIYWYSWENS
jgi:hypothetical protein